MTAQQLELITRRGRTLPEPTLTRLRTVGIWCEANLTLQRRDQSGLDHSWPGLRRGGQRHWTLRQLL